ncbi:MAG TPA: hypothetical protein VF669_11410 [Tepidisphaeraceae bacterium]|jgi:hypothetical protein
MSEARDQLQLDEPLPLEEATVTGLSSAEDHRLRIPEPLPVRLVAISDVRLPSRAGVEPALDFFYVGLLGFERIPPFDQLIYRADNYTLRFDVQEAPVVHESLRSLLIEVPSLADATMKLNEGKIGFTRQKSVAPGTESLVMLDPAGNWIELVETRILL